jgi:hypothetical protein
VRLADGSISTQHDGWAATSPVETYSAVQTPRALLHGPAMYRYRHPVLLACSHLSRFFPSSANAFMHTSE